MAEASRIVVMGPSASGKSLIGAAIAERLALPFVDADDLHPPANRAKMTAGTPLDDEDREPWLDIVAATLREATGGAVVACSALARRYRDRIRAGAPDAVFVELRVSRAELERRLVSREHFMPASLLASQLAALEPLHPDERGVAIANTDRPAVEIVGAAIAKLTAI